MTNLITIYGIYGETQGLLLYKYFDMHSLVSSVLAQVFIAVFQTNYVFALFFFAVFSCFGFYVTKKVDFTFQRKNSQGQSQTVENN